MKLSSILALCALMAQSAVADSSEKNSPETLYQIACSFAHENDDKLMSKALDYYKKAADAGHPEAATQLALCYLHGTGVDRNVSLGIMMLLEQAAADNASAIYNLALCYQSGIGTDLKGMEVSNGEQKAIELYTRAAQLGNAEAQWQLGCIYMVGQLVKQDLKRAFEYTQQAAMQGHVPAQFNLASFYENGEGTRQDRQQALQWYKKASEGGDDHAAQKVIELQSK